MNETFSVLAEDEDLGCTFDCCYSGIRRSAAAGMVSADHLTAKKRLIAAGKQTSMCQPSGKVAVETPSIPSAQTMEPFSCAEKTRSPFFPRQTKQNAPVPSSRLTNLGVSVSWKVEPAIIRSLIPTVHLLPPGSQTQHGRNAKCVSERSASNGLR